MNNHERVCIALTEYAKKHPEEVVNSFTRKQIIEIYQLTYPNLGGNNVSPSDICWNRVNGDNMTKSFEEWPHALEYHDGEYKILGNNIKYTGTVYRRRRGEDKDSIYGEFKDGKLTVTE